MPYKSLEDYKGKKVFVTGADGFIGSHLTEKLLDFGAEVHIFVKDNSTSYDINHRYFQNIDSDLISSISSVTLGDISSYDVKDTIRKIQPEIIFHLAATGYVPYSISNPNQVLRTISDGSINILEAAREVDSIEKVICFSSAAIYGEIKKTPIDEEHLIIPTTPYAAAKSSADRYCYAYWKTYKVPVSIVRPFNIFGPRHKYDVIPKFIYSILNDKPITVYGTGEQGADFLYVDDIIDGVLLLGVKQGVEGEAFNFGSGKFTKIIDLANLIKEKSQSSTEIKLLKEMPVHVEKLVCDNSKAKEILGWSPKTSLDSGISKNIEWCKIHWS